MTITSSLLVRPFLLFSFPKYTIGAGSAGVKAAITSSKFGAKVAVADYVSPSPAGTTWGLGGKLYFILAWTNNSYRNLY